MQFLRRLLAPAIAWLMLPIVVMPASADTAQEPAARFVMMSTSADRPQEPAVRAAMIFNLLKFTKWPVSLPANAPLRICLVEASAGLTAALQALDRYTVNSHPLATKSVLVNDLYACEVIVTDSVQVPYIPSQLQARGVLTIGEKGFIDRGGMIGITVMENRFRFEVNTSIMQDAGMVFPAQVLKLAVRTR